MATTGSARSVSVDAHACGPRGLASYSTLSPRQRSVVAQGIDSPTTVRGPNRPLIQSCRDASGVCSIECPTV